MANFTPHEQLMLELINRARMNPAGEAARYGIALNEGVPNADKISTTPKQVLAGNDQLGEAADRHSSWMLANDTFAHDEVPGTTGFYAEHFSDRETKAGYHWTHAGENIALTASSVPLDQTASIETLHQSLFVDLNYPGRGHRVNILANDFREVGVGNALGDYKTFPYVSDITTDFGTRPNLRFVTGVVYDDTVVNDDFFSVGEQTAGRIVSGLSTSSTTGAGGGYQLAASSGGTAKITFDLADGPLKVQFKLGSSNVKVDAVNGYEIWTNVSLTSKSAAITELHALGISKIDLTGRGSVEAIFGNSAANKLDGKGGADTLVGGGGKDTLVGGGGPDMLTGGAKADKFVFLKASDSAVATPDSITDFGKGGDKVDLTALYSGKLTYMDEAPITGLHQVNVTQSGADVIVHINLSGNMFDDMTITMLNTDISNMNAGDFLL